MYANIPKSTNYTTIIKHFVQNVLLLAHSQTFNNKKILNFVPRLAKFAFLTFEL